MVTVRSLGSNGRYANGLFQVACAISYGLRTKQPILFPEWKYFNAIQDSFLYQIAKEGQMPQLQQYREVNFHYNEVPTINNVDLYGYWQSEKYFKEHEKEIRELFSFRKDILLKLYDKWGDVSNHVAIHIRRKDYLDYQHYYSIPSREYYADAINSFRGDQNFIVFSDDIPFCKENFTTSRFIIAEGNEVEDLALMSLCKKGIIGANSTFSWWANWLGQHQTSIFPKLWFNPEHPDKLQTQDLYQKHWITI